MQHFSLDRFLKEDGLHIRARGQTRALARAGAVFIAGTERVLTGGSAPHLVGPDDSLTGPLASTLR